MADNVTVQIDQKQLDEILRKADPAKVKKHTERLVQYAGHHGRGVAMHNISGGTEQAKISIRSDYTASDMSAKVHSVMPPHRAMSIEVGRKPGEVPPYLQIARWVTGRRYMQTRHAAALSREQKAEIERVIQAIKAGGSKPKRFISGAHEAIKKDLPKALNEMAKEIESEWQK